MMVVAPTSTIDWSLENGDTIEIECRNPRELLPESYDSPDSLVSAWNPVFDVTPAELIDAIVTECGVVLNPSKQLNGIASLRV
jgi:methylthioribose-1-phosphate isomerase